MIIICLGAITWTGTHLLDPFRPLEQIGERRPVPENTPPLEVQVVALDWKWLFIYPQYGIATVNDVAAPVDRPVRFHLTSQSVMNAFYVPALAGMIYAMPGMESQLNAVMNVPGDYEGFSSQLQRRRLLRHALPVPRPGAGRLRRLGRQGPPRRRAACSTARRYLELAAAERERRADRLRATSTPTSSAASSTAASRRAGSASTR